MHRFWTRFARLNAPFLAQQLRALANQIEQLLPGPPALALPVIFLKGAPRMGAITVKDSDPAFDATVSFVDAKGAPTSPDDIPAWSSDNEDAATVAAADDGLTASVTPGMPGAAVISVSSTDTDGSVITAQGTVTVQPGEAVIGNVEFAPPPA